MWDSIQWVWNHLGWISGLIGVPAIALFVIFAFPVFKGVQDFLLAWFPFLTSLAGFIGSVGTKIVNAWRAGFDDITDSGATVFTVACILIGALWWMDNHSTNVAGASCQVKLDAVVADYKKRLKSTPKAMQSKPKTNQPSGDLWSIFKWP